MNATFVRSRRFWLLMGVLGVTGAIGAAATLSPRLRGQVARATERWGLRQTAEPAKRPADDHGHDHHDHAHDYDHGHPGHDDASAIELSTQAEGNIGLQTVTVKLGNYDRTISVPGMVVERPGRSVIRITTPLTGVVTQIHLIQGEAVKPGQPLFELRLTHEELVQAQSELLRMLGELDVVKREVVRLIQVTESGAVAAKVLLERQYEQQKLEANIEAQRQALLLHGLSVEQADTIIGERKLLRALTVSAPPAPQDAATAGERFLQVQQLNVEQGQQVKAGDPLCTLADHAELYIEGTAFEQDAKSLNRAAELDTPVTAVLSTTGEGPEVISDLEILYVANQIDRESRGLHFYVRLPNEQVRSSESKGHRFVSWRYKPGQRLKLRMPVETWTDQIVLPAPAVVRDGAETYVFQRFGDHFDRRSVRVIHSDSLSAVIAQDGRLKPGDVVAVSGAQQLHLAVKNRSGGAVDPHAGHSH